MKERITKNIDNTQLVESILCSVKSPYKPISINESTGSKKRESKTKFQRSRS